MLMDLKVFILDEGFYCNVVVKYYNIEYFVFRFLFFDYNLRWSNLCL